MRRSRRSYILINAGMWVMLALLVVHFFVFDCSYGSPGDYFVHYAMEIVFSTPVVLLILFFLLFPYPCFRKMSYLLESTLVIGVAFNLLVHLYILYISNISSLSIIEICWSPMLHFPPVLLVYLYFRPFGDSHCRAILPVLMAVYESLLITFLVLAECSLNGLREHWVSLSFFGFSALFLFAILVCRERFRVWVRVRKVRVMAFERKGWLGFWLTKLRDCQDGCCYPRKTLFVMLALLVVMNVFLIVAQSVHFRTAFSVPDINYSFDVFEELCPLLGIGLLFVCIAFLLMDHVSLFYSKTVTFIPAAVFLAVVAKVSCAFYRMAYYYNCEGVFHFERRYFGYSIPFAVAAFIVNDKLRRLVLSTIACCFVLFEYGVQKYYMFHVVIEPDVETPVSKYLYDAGCAAFKAIPVILLILSISLWHRYRFLARHERAMQREAAYSDSL